MAKKTKKEPVSSSEMPICVAMIVCEKVLFDKENVATAIRVVDNITLGDQIPQQGELFGLPLTLLAFLKTGSASGRVDLSLVNVDPSGKRTPIATAPTDFEGEPEYGKNMCQGLQLVWNGPGLYWLEIVAGSRLIAKTPIRLHLPPAMQIADSNKDEGKKPLRRAK